jgi:HK97 family phage major capsid protein
MDQLTELNNLTHQYRKTLEQFSERKDAKTHEIEARGSGEEREKIARLDSDMTEIEKLIQLRKVAAEAAAPEFTARVADDDGKWLYEGMSARKRKQYAGREYTERFMGAIIGGDMAAFRALSTGTSNAPVPTDLERRIIEKRQQVSVMRQLATVMTIDSTREVSVEGALPTTAKVAEGGTITPPPPQ